MSGFSIAYTALGVDHVREAAISAWSAKRHMPGVRTVLVTDRSVSSPWFDEVRRVQPDEGDPSRAAKLSKLAAVEAAPGERVLVIDADTYFLDDVSDVWSSARSFELAAVYDTWQYGEVYRQLCGGRPVRDPPPSEPFLNAGVLFVTKTRRMRKLLARWHAGFAADPLLTRDQLVLRELVWASNLELRVLPNIYNARAGEPLHLSGRIRILHRYSLAALGWRRSSAFLGDFLNRTEHNRVFLPGEGRMVTLELDGKAEEHRIEAHEARLEREEYLHPALLVEEERPSLESVPKLAGT